MHIVRLLCLAVLIASGAACEKKPQSVPGPARLVMLNVFCTLGTDFLGAYDEKIAFTPNLDRFASDGVVFERHMTEAGQSGVSFASILTGMHAMGHHVYSHPTKLDPELETLPEAFAAAGWDTFFFEAQPMASIDLGYGQGVPGKHAFHDRHLTSSDPEFRRILTRLEDDPSYKAFIISFYSLTHAPYSKYSVSDFCSGYPGECEDIDPDKATPLYEDYRAFTYDFPATAKKWGLEGDSLREFVDALEMIYKSRVHLTDAVFGELVDAIDRAGIRDRAIIAFTADHGETLYRDNSLFKWSHSFDLSHDVMRVPLIISAPGLDRRRFTDVSSSVDVAPTVAALAGVPFPSVIGASPRAFSLVGAREKGPAHRVVFGHTGLWPTAGGRKWWIRQPHLLKYHPRYSPDAVWVSARSGDLVVKHRRGENGDFIYEAFDLASDPRESRNIFDPNDTYQQSLVRRLQSYRRALIDSHVDPRRTTQSEPAAEAVLEQQLRALGYID